MYIVITNTIYRFTFVQISNHDANNIIRLRFERLERVYGKKIFDYNAIHIRIASTNPKNSVCSFVAGHHMVVTPIFDNSTLLYRRNDILCVCVILCSFLWFISHDSYITVNAPPHSKLLSLFFFFFYYVEIVYCVRHRGILSSPPP